ncbi:MAG TPA: toll/interleukin-1 receptor domain-containing protein, partial [Anaerolineales bacterium]|nr:toll/interleukin-1 receptor domain-containing protein [Anaerolineales bacterium]
MDKRPLKVFLCHAHADRDPVRGLYTRLTQDGVDAWLDKANLLPGQDWELEIRKAVREADVVVVCLSKQFNQAGFRQKEVRLALDTAMEKPEGEIFIIPARLEECDNLESLRKWHWVDLFEDDGYDMLIRALRARADRIGAILQIKKSWLPKITLPLSKLVKPIEENNLELPKKKTLKKRMVSPDEPPPDNFPDGWDDVWKKGFESASNVEKNKLEKKEDIVETPVEKKLEKSEPKKEIQAPKNFNKNTFGIIGFIVLVLVSVFGLPSLIGKPEKPSSTATNTVSVKTFTPI